MGWAVKLSATEVKKREQNHKLNAFIISTSKSYPHEKRKSLRWAVHNQPGIAVGLLLMCWRWAHAPPAQSAAFGWSATWLPSERVPSWSLNSNAKRRTTSSSTWDSDLLDLAIQTLFCGSISRVAAYFATCTTKPWECLPQTSRTWIFSSTHFVKISRCTTQKDIWKGAKACCKRNEVVT